MSKEIKKRSSQSSRPKAVNQNKKQIPTIPQELETVLGAINWLTINSAQHRHLFISDLDWSIVPPVMLKQFKLFKGDDGRTVGYVSWANLSQDIEDRILKTGNMKLAPSDWNSGNIIHIIDVLTPFGGNRDIIVKLYESLFKDKQEVFVVRPKKEGKGLEKISLKSLIVEKTTNSNQ